MMFVISSLFVIFVKNKIKAVKTTTASSLACLQLVHPSVLASLTRMLEVGTIDYKFYILGGGGAFENNQPIGPGSLQGPLKLHP